MNPSISEHKKQLRKTLRHSRRQLNTIEREQFAIRMTQHFISSSYFMESQQIAFYIPQDGEMDPTLVLKQAWQLGKWCYLPVMKPQHSKQLSFFRYEPNDSLHANKHGILEPTSEKHSLDPNQLDLVLLPLVGFDLKGARLGMGAGYYDYTFSFRKTAEKPLLIGVGYECQQCDALSSEPWDIPLDGVVTEKCFYVF